MVQLSDGQLQIPHTQHIIRRFREIQNELAALLTHRELQDFVPAWLRNEMDESDPFHKLVLDVALTVGSPEELLDAVIEGVSQPEIPPDVTEVRIMSLHKSKGLSSPVVIIPGCVEGLLPSAPDPDLTPAENRAALEEQRRLSHRRQDAMAAYRLDCRADLLSRLRQAWQPVSECHRHCRA